MNTPTRTVVRTIGIVVALVIVLAIAASLISRSLRSTDTGGEDLPGSLTTLSVQSGVGDVSIRAAAPGESASVAWTSRHGLVDPTVTVQVTGETARMVSDCPSFWFADCSVDWELVVPAEVAVTIDTSVGDVSMTDLTGTVEVTSNVGSVSGTDLGGEHVQVRSDVGDVTLDLVVAPRAVTVGSDTGDVTITVPDDGTGYHVTTDTSIGDVRNTIGSDATQTRRINVSSSVGDITLQRTSPVG